MSEIRSRDDLLIIVNRLMICAMEDIDCGRNEAGPTTLDLVQRIEDHDAALRAENAKLREALPSDEDECPCCLTHSCEAFRAYVSRARAAEGEGKG